MRRDVGACLLFKLESSALVGGPRGEFSERANGKIGRWEFLGF